MAACRSPKDREHDEEDVRGAVSASIAGSAPITVTKNGSTYVVSLATDDVVADILGGTCWVWQLKMALQTTSNLRAVHEAVSADVTNQVNMIWSNGWRSSKGDLRRISSNPRLAGMTAK